FRTEIEVQEHDVGQAGGDDQQSFAHGSTAQLHFHVRLGIQKPCQALTQDRVVVENEYAGFSHRSLYIYQSPPFSRTTVKQTPSGTGSRRRSPPKERTMARETYRPMPRPVASRWKGSNS